MNKLKRIIVGIDFSPPSVAAAEIAKTLAQYNDAELLLLHSIEYAPTTTQARALGMPLSELDDVMMRQADGELDIIMRNLQYDKIFKQVTKGKASDRIAEACSNQKDTLTVVGDIGYTSGEAHRSLGSTAYRLLRSFPCKLLVARPLRTGSISKIAAAIDIEAGYDEVVDQAKRLALATEAKVDVVYVYPTNYTHRLERAAGEDYVMNAIAEATRVCSQRLDSIMENIDWEGVEIEQHVLAGSPALKLIEFARAERADIMVIGATVVSGLARYFIGSTALQVIQHTPSSVLVV